MMKLVVLSCILAAASASVVAPIAPLGLSPLVYSAYAAPFVASNYRGPLSLAPGQPAEILGSDGRPLDTLEVNQDRAAHLTAKALKPFRLLKKRSAAFIAPVSAYTVASSPLITPASPITYTAPLAAPLAASLAAPLAPLSYASAPVVHLLKKRSAAVIAPIAPIAKLAVASPLISAPGAIAYSVPYGAARIAPLTYAAAPISPWYK